MGKKENGFLVLIGLIVTIMMGVTWGSALYPKEAVTHFEAVITGAFTMFFTLLVIGLDALVYLIAVAED